jgi:hypothetical protein
MFLYYKELLSNIIMSLITECTFDNTPEFSLCGMTLQGRVLSCYDADTNHRL